MKTPMTLGQFIAFIVFVIPTSLFWAYNTHGRLTKIEGKVDVNESNVIELKEEIKPLLIEMDKKLHSIELELKDKKDRE